VPSSTNDISERYLKKAIAEMNDLGREIGEAAGPDRAPVLGSGHPQAEIFLLKHRPQPSEIHEGVAFFGRAGQAVLKSIQRLRVDPTAIYGTNCLKYENEPEEEALVWLTRELHIVEPKLVVVMGQDALACLNATRFPLSIELEPTLGSIQKFTPTVDALLVPDIDAALDEADAKRGFWEAFKAVGPWWSELPPY
jgi:uracil-DNA glycosylase